MTDASDSIMAESWSDDKKREAAEVLVNSTLESSGAEGNMAKPLDEKNIVEIKGNIISTKHARTGVALTNKESKLTGLVSGTTWRGIGENYVTLKTVRFGKTGIIPLLQAVEHPPIHWVAT